MTGKDILIVEDETIVAFDMKVRLEALGYRVVGLADGAASALEFAQRGKPDLVLMDIKLKGGEDGIEVASQIRERDELPIIFVTAFTDDETLDRAKRASPYGYIVKPFHERELRIAIELALYKFQYELSMRQAKEFAEETSRLKSEFLANMSHELKTPLNSVIGFVELALDRKADEEQAEYLSTALSSAKRLVGLIDSVLDFARLEAGRVSAHAAPFSLDELLEECVELLAVGAYAKGLELRYRRSADLPARALGDAGLIRKILLSLAENAVKFTERGMVGLIAEMATDPPAKGGDFPARPVGGYVLRLVLEDSGIGMPPERLSEAFQRFLQLDSSRTRAAGGTGLGLAIVKKSVELLEGRVLVQSEEGQGCRFEILVPLGCEPGLTGTTAPAPSGGIALAGFPAERIEDAMESLRGLGRELHSASGIAAASELVGAEGFVLADELALPMELEAARRLGPRLVLCHRFGGNGRARASEEGFRALSLPLRPLALSRSLEAPQPRPAHPKEAPAGLSARRTEAAAGEAEECMESPSPGREEGLIGRLPAARDGYSDPGQDLLGRFADILGASLEPLDCARIEREAKDYSNLFDQIGGRAYGRLAFSALLLARRGDGQGLRDLLGRVRATLALEGPG